MLRSLLCGGKAEATSDDASSRGALSVEPDAKGETKPAPLIGASSPLQNARSSLHPHTHRTGQRTANLTTTSRPQCPQPAALSRKHHTARRPRRCLASIAPPRPFLLPPCRSSASALALPTSPKPATEGDELLAWKLLFIPDLQEPTPRTNLRPLHLPIA